MYVKRPVNLLKQLFIKKLLSYLHWVIAETEIPYSGEPHLFNILHFDYNQIPPLKIASICNEISGNRRSREKASHLRTYLAELAAGNSNKLFSGDPLTDSLIRVHQVLEKLMAESLNKPLLRWLESLINESGILHYIMQQPDKSWYMRQLNGFFDYVQDECRRNPDLDLKGLVRQIDLLEENGIALPLVQTSGNRKAVF